MVALAQGVPAPDFSLATLGGQKVSLGDALRKGPVVLAFFKVGCPVCQYAFPFLQRLYEANRAANVTVLGISQDNAKKTQAFMREFGVTFPVAVDDPERYAVSNAYGLTNVPTVFYIAPDGLIEISSVSWSKAEVEAINAKLASHRNQQPSILWKPGEEIRDFRPG